MEAEPKLRRQIEDVAALRRRLPKGGKIKENYVFEEGAADFSDRTTVKQTRFSELFHPGKNSLVVYSFMYAPDWEKPCPSCSSILDRLNGIAPHVTHSGRTLPSPPKRRFKACAIGRAEETGRICGCCPRGKTATTLTMALNRRIRTNTGSECLPKERRWNPSLLQHGTSLCAHGAGTKPTARGLSLAAVEHVRSYPGGSGNRLVSETLVRLILGS